MGSTQSRLKQLLFYWLFTFPIVLYFWKSCLAKSCLDPAQHWEKQTTLASESDSDLPRDRNYDFGIKKASTWFWSDRGCVIFLHCCAENAEGMDERSMRPPENAALYWSERARFQTELVWRFLRAHFGIINRNTICQRHGALKEQTTIASESGSDLPHDRICVVRIKKASTCFWSDRGLVIFSHCCPVNAESTDERSMNGATRKRRPLPSRETINTNRYFLKKYNLPHLDQINRFTRFCRYH